MNRTLMNAVFRIMLVVLMSGILWGTGQGDKYLDLVFPDPDHPIILVTSDDSNQKSEFLSGKEASWDTPLARRIKAELNFPFHRSIIKLVQCSRNFSGDHDGPNVLFLSKNQGGFPRTGLFLRGKDGNKTYPELNYVDLVLDEERLDRGELEIFSHEFGHVMMNNIWEDFGKTAGDKLSPKQHVSMGITDYYVAFYEGWGIHFQSFAHDIGAYRAAFNRMFDYDRITESLWHSNLDHQLRINSVLQNNYIFQKLLPKGSDKENLSLEETILLEHTSPLFDRTRLKNAQQMLSCEGVAATLFVKINSNPRLQGQYVKKDFYNSFLLSPLPESVAPGDVFSPFENVILKNFWVWQILKEQGDNLKNKSVLIQFIKEWCRSFPADRGEILSIFLSVTAGKSIDNDLGDIYEDMAFYGQIGNYQKFRQLGDKYKTLYREKLRQILGNNIELDSNVGPELWIKNKNFSIRTTLWIPDRKQALSININTASVYELSSFSGVDLSMAQKIVSRRDEIGFFRYFDELKGLGFLLK